MLPAAPRCGGGTPISSPIDGKHCIAVPVGGPDPGRRPCHHGAWRDALRLLGLGADGPGKKGRAKAHLFPREG